LRILSQDVPEVGRLINSLEDIHMLPVPDDEVFCEAVVAVGLTTTVVGVEVGFIAVAVGSIMAGVVVGCMPVGLGSTVIGVAVGATKVDGGWIVVGVGLAMD